MTMFRMRMMTTAIPSARRSGIQETNYVYDVEDRLVRVEDGIGSDDC